MGLSSSLHLLVLSFLPPVTMWCRWESIAAEQIALYIPISAPPPPPHSCTDFPAYDTSHLQHHKEIGEKKQEAQEKIFLWQTDLFGKRGSSNLLFLRSSLQLKRLTMWSDVCAAWDKTGGGSYNYKLFNSISDRKLICFLKWKHARYRSLTWTMQTPPWALSFCPPQVAKQESVCSCWLHFFKGWRL